jgi:hypothetical protein
MPSVYLETTIPSYLTAWRSPELSMAAKQQTTRQWWDERRISFDLFISDAVLLEASAGDPAAAERRLEALAGIPVLNPLPEADDMHRRSSIDYCFQIEHWPMPLTLQSASFTAWITCSRGTARILPTRRCNLLFMRCATISASQCP